MVSLALQYGVPWAKIRDKFLDTRFGMADETNKSLLDGLMKMVDHCVQQRRSIIGEDEVDTLQAQD